MNTLDGIGPINRRWEHCPFNYGERSQFRKDSYFDIHPCTVVSCTWDSDMEDWQIEAKGLFGETYVGWSDQFTHPDKLEKRLNDMQTKPQTDKS